MQQEIQKILNEQMETPEGEITTKEELNRMTEILEENNDADDVAETTTGSGRATFEQGWIGHNTAQAFRLAGISGPEEKMFNMGAPPDHYSGQATSKAGEKMDIEVLNEHIGHMERMMEQGKPLEEATSVAGIPNMVLQKGKLIREQMGDAYSPESAFLAGDQVIGSMRRDLKSQLGIENVAEGYATSENGVIATEVEGVDVENRVLMPLLNQFAIELYPLSEIDSKAAGQYETLDDYQEALREGPDSTDELVDIRDLEDVTKGRVYITRDGLERYDQSDFVTAIPGTELNDRWPDEIPGIKVNGRIGGGTFAGPTITEGQVEDLVNDISGGAITPEWNVMDPQQGYESTFLLVSTEQVEEETLYDAVQEHAPALYHAEQNGLVDIEYRQSDNPGLTRGSGPKVNRIG